MTPYVLLQLFLGMFEYKDADYLPVARSSLSSLRIFSHFAKVRFFVQSRTATETTDSVAVLGSVDNTAGILIPAMYA